MCPCGTRCEYGECSFDCTSDADCSGDGTCDPFGRCSTEAVLPLDTGSDEHFFVARPGALYFSSDRPEQTTVVRLGEGGQAIELRVAVTSSAYQVACPEAPERFASSCGVALNEAKPFGVLRVRRLAETSGEAAAFLRVRGRDRVRVVTLDPGTTELATPPMEGSYVGRALLTTLDSPEVGAVDLGAVASVPVEVFIGASVGGRAPVAIEDPLGVFAEPNSAGHPIVGYLESFEGGTGFIPVGRYGWAEITHPRLSSVSVSASVTGLDVLERSGSRLKLALRQAIGAGVEPWRVRWQLDLEVSGAPATDLVEAAPASSGADPEEAIREPSPLEQQFTATAGEGAMASVDRVLCSDASRVRGFAPGLAQLTERLDGRPAAEYAYFDGDVGCAVDEGLPERWPLLPLYGMASLTGGDQELALVSCAAELDGAQGRADFPCIELDRWLSALGVGLTSARLRALGEAATTDTASERVGAYLVARMLDLFDFMDEIERSRAQVRARLELGDPLPADFPTRLGYLESVHETSDLILHPRVFETLRSLHPGALLNPDYRLDHARRDVEVVYRLDLDLHASPLFVTLMSHLAERAQLFTSLSEALVRGEYLGSEATRLRALLGEGVRRSLLMSLLASELYARAEANQASPFPERWDRELEAGARRFSQAVHDVGEDLGVEPLNFGALGLPWFRVGDQTGASARSRAMSDFMLGNGEGLGGVVGAELARARAARSEAISAFARARSENLSLLATVMWQNAYQDQLALSLGSRAVDLCGYDSSRYDARGGYAIFTESEDPDRCFIDDRAECAASPPSPAGAALLLCRAAHHVREGGVGPFDSLRGLEALRGDLESSFGEAHVEVAEAVVAMSVPDRLARMELPAVDLNGFLAYATTRGASPSFLAEVESVCARVYDRHRGTSSARTCVVDYEAQHLGEAGAVSDAPDCEGASDEALAFGELDASCFRGELGLAALAIRDAQLDVFQAQAELEALTASFSAEFGACEIQLEGLEAKEELYHAFLELMHSLRETKRNYQIAVATLEATAACLGAWQSSVGDNAAVAAIKGNLAAGICAVNVGKAALQGLLASIEEDIANAQEELSANLDILNASVGVASCFELLEGRLAQMRPMSVRLRTAAARYGERLVEFEHQQSVLHRVQDEAAVWSSRLQQIRLAAVPQDYDYQARFDTYERALDALRRSLSYAGRAVEFELQRSLLDADLLNRTHELSELEALARNLQLEVISGRVGAGQSNETRLVSSLRDDILRLPQPEGQPPGFHQLPNGMALAEVLSSRQNAVFDETGSYLGQRVRFSLAPTGLGRGESGVANQLGGAVCAERLWRVGAVVVGEDSVEVEDSGLTRLFLRKRNGFYARRCDGEGLVEGFVSPASYGLGGEPRPDEQAVDRYSQALLNGYVYRSDLAWGARQAIERRELNPESSGELAGLGLYGDYELFIPAESLGERALRLSGVEDILLVFELVLATEE